MAEPGQVVLSAPIPFSDARSHDWESVVRTHGRLVYQVTYSVLRNHHDAEDATQETFMRVIRHAAKWSKVRDQRAWLARVAWRVALDRRKSVPEVSFDETAEAVFKLRAAGAEVEQIAASKQLMVLVERLIATLPRALRDALVLSTVEEMTSAEVAAVLKIPEASVRTRLFRARQLLRAKLSTVLEGKHVR